MSIDRAVQWNIPQVWVDRAGVVVAQLNLQSGSSIEAQRTIASALYQTYRAGMLASSRQPGVGLKAT